MNELNGTTAMVIGGAGFIGSHLVDALTEKGVRCVVVDNLFLGDPANLEQASLVGEVTLYREDAADYVGMKHIIEQESPDIVFNLATKALLYSFVHPLAAFEVNTAIVLTLLDHLRDGTYKRLVHVSSSEAYGTALSVPMREDHPLLPETTYAAGKAAADLAVRSYVNMFNLDALIVRPFNTYGPRQSPGYLSAIVPRTIGRLMNNEPPVIEGSGTQTRDFSFVGDVAAAIMRLGFQDGSIRNPVNVASGNEVPIVDLVEMISSEMEFEGEPVFVKPRDADVARHVADVSLLEQLLPIRPKTSLQAGLRLTIEWFRNRAEWRAHHP